MPHSEKTYTNPPPPPHENDVRRGGFDPAQDRAGAPPPKQERRPIDAATMPDLVRGGVNAEDAPSGKIQE